MKGTWKKEGDWRHHEITAEAPYARIEDMGNTSGQGWIALDCLRVYCTQYPTQFNFQIRTCKPIARKGKPRVMLATVGMSVDQITALYEFVRDYQKNSTPPVKP